MTKIFSINKSAYCNTLLHIGRHLWSSVRAQSPEAKALQHLYKCTSASGCTIYSWRLNGAPRPNLCSIKMTEWEAKITSFHSFNGARQLFTVIKTNTFALAQLIPKPQILYIRIDIKTNSSWLRIQMCLYLLKSSHQTSHQLLGLMPCHLGLVWNHIWYCLPWKMNYFLVMWCRLKGTDHPQKLKGLSSFTCNHVVSNLYHKYVVG